MLYGHIGSINYFSAVGIDDGQGIVCAMGVWGEVGILLGQGVGSGETAQDGVVEAGGVVIPPQALHVNPLFATVQAVGLLGVV